MKNYYRYVGTIVLSFLIVSINAQTINWTNLNEAKKNIVNINVGIEYGAVYEIGYSHQIKSKLFPAVIGIESSLPFGEKTFDDIKTKIGGQIRWISFNHFQISTKVYGIIRRYQNDFVRLVNFGSDITGMLGYYRPKWFIIAEAGFDKAIVTNFKHSKSYLNEYENVINGWYKPPTGGNFYYGLQAGIHFKKYDLYLDLGQMLKEDFKSSPTIPFYALLGYNINF